MNDVYQDILAKVLSSVVATLVVWLPIGISYAREQKAFYSKFSEDYCVLRQPRYAFGIGIGGAALFVTMFIAAVFFSKTVVGYAFLPFALLCSFLTVAYLQYKIVVVGDKLEIYPIIKKPFILDISNIDLVKQMQAGIRIYSNGKKMVDVDNYIVGYHILYDKLFKAGKMESTLLQDAFVVRHPKQDIIVTAIATPLFIGLIINAKISNHRSFELADYLIIAGVLLIGGYFLFSFISWRIEVIGRIIMIRKPFGKSVEMLFHEISEVRQRKDGSIALLDGETVLIRVKSTYKGAKPLLERLENEGVPTYYE